MFINLSSLTLSVLSAQQKASWGLNGLIMGLGSVFIILVLLILVINLLKLTSVNKKKTGQVKPLSSANDSAVKAYKEDESEIIAVIIAAINCMAQREGKKFAIKSYKRVGTRTNRSY